MVACRQAGQRGQAGPRAGRVDQPRPPPAAAATPAASAHQDCSSERRDSSGRLRPELRDQLRGKVGPRPEGAGAANASRRVSRRTRRSASSLRHAGQSSRCRSICAAASPEADPRSASAFSRTSRQSHAQAVPAFSAAAAGTAPARASSIRSQSHEPRCSRDITVPIGHAERLGDFLVGQVLDVTEQDDVLVRRRKLLQRRQHVLVGQVVGHRRHERHGVARSRSSSAGSRAARAALRRRFARTCCRIETSQARQFVPGVNRWNDWSACTSVSCTRSSASMRSRSSHMAWRNSRSTCGIASASKAGQRRLASACASRGNHRKPRHYSMRETNPNPSGGMEYPAPLPTYILRRPYARAGRAPTRQRRTTRRRTECPDG